MLAAYFFSQDGIYNFDLIKNIKQFPQKIYFSKFTKKLGDFSEIKKYWIPAQELINQDNKIRFFKTHNMLGKFRGFPFTNSENTLGAIYIVRDPRNVITSLMNHYSINEDEGLKMLDSTHRNLRDANDENNFATYSFISSWANNYNSWKMSKNIKKILIRYEDLEKDKENTFIRIVKFVNLIMGKKDYIDKNKLRKSIETTNFDLLKKKEESEGFAEATYSIKDGKKISFFNLGSENNYKKLLKSKTINLIEEIYKEEMRELGYI